MSNPLIFSYCNCEANEVNIWVGLLNCAIECVFAGLFYNFFISSKPFDVRSWQCFNFAFEMKKVSFLSRWWLTEEIWFNSFAAKIQIFWYHEINTLTKPINLQIHLKDLMIRVLRLRGIGIFHGQTNVITFFAMFVTYSYGIVSSIFLWKMTNCQGTICPVTSSFQKGLKIMNYRTIFLIRWKIYVGRPNKIWWLTYLILFIKIKSS